MSKLCSQYFSASGSWTAPAGVTQVMVLAHGGGASGNGGLNATGTSQILLSASTVPYIVTLDVTPNTAYTITIGAGGATAAARVSAAANANPGGNTTFGALWTFYGGIADGGVNAITVGPTAGTIDIGQCIGVSEVGQQMRHSNGYLSVGTNAGTTSGSYFGGRNGLLGYSGTNGNGGNANNAGNGADGAAATGFGCSGGQGGAGSASGGQGGAGAPGQLWVLWCE